MSAEPIVDAPSSTNERRPSDDVLLKHITLLNAQIQKTLSKLTIPKVLVLYTGLNERKVIWELITMHFVV